MTAPVVRLWVAGSSTDACQHDLRPSLSSGTPGHRNRDDDDEEVEEEDDNGDRLPEEDQEALEDVPEVVVSLDGCEGVHHLSRKSCWKQRREKFVSWIIGIQLVMILMIWW